jgi:hypothetical protein
LYTVLLDTLIFLDKFFSLDTYISITFIMSKLKFPGGERDCKFLFESFFMGFNDHYYGLYEQCQKNTTMIQDDSEEIIYNSPFGPNRHLPFLQSRTKMNQRLQEQAQQEQAQEKQRKTEYSTFMRHFLLY